MDIPPDIKLASFHQELRQGTLFRMRGEEPFRSGKYHVFIVLNYDPSTDEALILVNGSSQVDKRLEFYKKRPDIDPGDTTVVIEEGEYSFFSKRTIIDCNSVRRCHISQDSFESGNLLMINDSLSDDDMGRIINGVLCSRTVSQFIKSKIKPPTND